MDWPTHAITICQPWVELIMLRLKRWEIRTWPMPRHYVGVPLGIHAGRVCKADVAAQYGLPPASLPRGVIIGRAVFAPSIPFRVLYGCAIPLVGGPEVDPALSACPGVPRDTGDTWWAWPVAEVERVDPIPARGWQGIWAIERAEVGDARPLAQMSLRL
jgi:hypothetical protein